jgi:hypothetical protein
MVPVYARREEYEVLGYFDVQAGQLLLSAQLE